MKKPITLALISFLLLFICIFTACESKITIADVNVYDYVGDKLILSTPQMFDDGFHLEIQNADESVEKDGIGRQATIQNSATGQERAARAEEWGYSVTKLDGITDGMGREIHSTIKGDNVPATREEAVESLKTYLDIQYKQKSISGVYY